MSSYGVIFLGNLSKSIFLNTYFVKNMHFLKNSKINIWYIYDIIDYRSMGLGPKPTDIGLHLIIFVIIF